MATAETRRKEEEARTQDGGVQNGSPARRESRSKRSTRQLDFFQAMSDFKSMFPTLDDEVIEAVLRANDGAVDATIDQLLTMTIDEDMSSVKGEEGATFNTPEVGKFRDEENAVGGSASRVGGSASRVGGAVSGVGGAVFDVGGTVSEDSPPSYSEAMRTPGPTDQAQSIWTTPIGPPKLQNRNQLKLEVDSHPEPLGAMACLSPSGLQSNTNLGLGFSSPTREAGDFCVQRNSVSDNLNLTSRKREYRNWNPPMLGNLPDDFLRLMLPDTNNGTPSAKTDSDKKTSLSTTPVNVLSLTETRPKIHKSRSKSEKVSRHSSIGSKDTKESKSRSAEKKGKSSDKVQRSFSLMDGKSAGARHKEKHSAHSPSQTRKHGVIIETHDFSKGMLEERIKENERRRKKTSAECDPELAQYLEDERLALALQNSEFLQELRSNDDFMKILQKEHLTAKTETNSSSSQTPTQTSTHTTTTPLRPTDDLYEGYGNDSDKTLDAFPFSQPTASGKDQDAELRRQLSGMGKASKKQLSSLARKFFKRKKKNSKQILGEKLAPSMMNLLEDEDEEDDDLNIDSRYGNSPPEIEPLPSTLIGVPGHRTVQRPPYKPDGVTTYFDNNSVDMV